MCRTFGDRDHDVVREEVNVRDSNRLGGVNMPIKTSEEHCIGKHHQVTFDHTCHSLGYDGDADDVDVHLYRSMIGSLMYLTASRPDIMFAKSDGFRYLKGIPTLGLWYSRDSPFELVAYTDSDYAGATLDRKSTIGGTPIKGREELTIEESKNIYGTDGGKEEKHLLHSETRKELPPLTNYHHHMAQQETSNDHQNVM
ncbi:hypothetical protein Tco_0823614 [Tanacetum coccineum]|uniref:Mitochondrial protein n=1 Tax=Tanacetum coccineum TaxID=301880 RepID=A0ABQ5AIJ1_9ASTR